MSFEHAFEAIRCLQEMWFMQKLGHILKSLTGPFFKCHTATGVVQIKLTSCSLGTVITPNYAYICFSTSTGVLLLSMRNVTLIQVVSVNSLCAEFFQFLVFQK